MTNIYALLDPRTSECRYIGKANEVRRRLLKHLAPAQLKLVTHKTTWIKNLLSFGELPEIVVLEEVPDNEWSEHEKWWIGYFKSLGANLTNGTKGGDGGIQLVPSMLGRKGKLHPGYGKPRPDYVRKKISESHKGVPRNFKPEVIEKLITRSKAAVGDKNPFFGKTHSDETKSKWSEKRKGLDPLRNFTPEQRAEKHRLSAETKRRNNLLKNNAYDVK